MFSPTIVLPMPLGIFHKIYKFNDEFCDFSNFSRDQAPLPPSSLRHHMQRTCPNVPALHPDKLPRCPCKMMDPRMPVARPTGG